MKTIEEASIEYVKSNFLLETIWAQETQDAFKSGAEFAQQWIPVEEKPETPKRDEEGIFYSDDLLLKVKGFDHYLTGYYVKANDDEFFDICPEVSEIVNQEDITHYRYIDLK